MDNAKWGELLAEGAKAKTSQQRRDFAIKLVREVLGAPWLVKLREVGGLLGGLSRSTMMRMVKRGELPIARPAGPQGDLFVDPADLIKLAKTSRRGTAHGASSIAYLMADKGIVFRDGRYFATLNTADEVIEVDYSTRQQAIADRQLAIRERFGMRL